MRTDNDNCMTGKCEDKKESLNVNGTSDNAILAQNIEVVECEEQMDWCEASFSPIANLVQRGCFSRNYTANEWGCTTIENEFSCR